MWRQHWLHRPVEFGDVGAVWGVLQDLGVEAVIDEVTGARRSDAGAPAGTYLALAALNRLGAPRSKAAFPGWGETTAPDPVPKIPAPVLDHPRVFGAAPRGPPGAAAEDFPPRPPGGAGRASGAGAAPPPPAAARRGAGRAGSGGPPASAPRRTVYGAERRAILTHSPELRNSQARGFDGTTLAKAGKKLDELAATLARGKTRRGRDKVQAEIESITRKPWVRRVIT